MRASSQLVERVTVVADYKCALGENPLWHAEKSRLLWTDITNGKLFWLDPVSRNHGVLYQGLPVGGFTIQTDGSLLLFKENGAITRLKDGTEMTLITEIPAERGLRFNDVIADPLGRVLCGTYAEGKPGRLYRLDTDGSLTMLLDGIGCSNGMAFSIDQKFLYYIDSIARHVYRFAYDPKHGSLSDQRVFYAANPEDGLPDGCTLDSEGYLWVAFWNGACIKRLNPNGNVDKTINIPAKMSTSLTFGGPNLTDIYVTSAGGEKRSATDPLAGALFHMRSQIRGVPEFSSRVAFL